MKKKYNHLDVYDKYSQPLTTHTEIDKIINQLRNRIGPPELSKEQQLLQLLLKTLHEHIPPNLQKQIKETIDPNKLEKILEELPILIEDENSLPINRAVGFILSYDIEARRRTWLPVHVLNPQHPKTTMNNMRWAEYRVDYKDGSCESGITRWPEWAHATMDHKPNLDLYDTEEKEEDIEEKKESEDPNSDCTTDLVNDAATDNKEDLVNDANVDVWEESLNAIPPNLFPSIDIHPNPIAGEIALPRNYPKTPPNNP